MVHKNNSESVTLLTCYYFALLGTEECTDGEDEKHGSCAPDPEEKKHCELSKGEFACDTHEYMSKCVSFSQVCDGHTDCIGGRDESDEFCKGE